MSAKARFPTGVDPGAAALFAYRTESGLAGFGAAFAGDVFFGSRFWLSGAAAYEVFGEREVERRITSPGVPFAPASSIRLVRHQPGARTAAELAPRLILADAVSLGAVYRYTSAAGDGWDLANGSLPVPLAGRTPVSATVLGTETRTTHRIGGGLSYTSFRRGTTDFPGLPVEASVLYLRTFNESGVLPTSSLVLRASVFAPLWGRR